MSKPKVCDSQVPVPGFADQLNQIELATAMEAAERRSLEIPVVHWNSLIERFPCIESSPWIRDGQPVISGTRIPVSVVIGYLTLGPGKEQLLQDYPDLSEASIKEAVDFTLETLGD